MNISEVFPKLACRAAITTVLCCVCFSAVYGQVGSLPPTRIEGIVIVRPPLPDPSAGTVTLEGQVTNAIMPDGTIDTDLIGRPVRGAVVRLGEALDALKAYEVGKPLVIEEMFPLKCGKDELVEFVKKSAVHTDGWISFYWGTPAEELLKKENTTIAEAITASWLKQFRELRNSDGFAFFERD